MHNIAVRLHQAKFGSSLLQLTIFFMNDNIFL